MVSIKHEKLLQAGIKELEKQGFRVIRVDRRIIPDAIAIKENEVFAIEADTSPSKIWLTKKKLKNDNQYDSSIIITSDKPSSYYHEPEVYYKVLKLYNLKRFSIREIRKKVIDEFNLKSLSISTIHDWVKGRKKPFCV